MMAAGSAYSDGLDSDLLESAALCLRPAQAPGSALAVLLGHAISGLPLGPLPLRIAFGSSLAAALAAGALYRAIEASTGARPRRPTLYTSAPLALAAVLFAFGCDPLFVADARAHIVGVALACLCFERLATAHEASAAAKTAHAAQPLRSAAFWLGLLIIEQPALALCVWLASLPLLRRLRRERPFARYESLAAGTACLLALALVSLSARDTQRTQGALAASTRLFLGAFQLADGSSLSARLSMFSPSAWALLGVTLLSAVRAARATSTPRHVTGWLVVTLTSLIGSISFANAAPLQALTLCGAAATCALVVSDLFEADVPRRLAFAVAMLAVALGGARLRATALRHMQHDNRVFDALREPLLRALPSRSAVLLEPHLARALLGAEVEERVRPDLVLAIKPWRLDLSASEELARSAPELKPRCARIYCKANCPSVICRHSPHIAPR